MKPPTGWVEKFDLYLHGTDLTIAPKDWHLVFRDGFMIGWNAAIVKYQGQERLSS